LATKKRSGSTPKSKSRSAASEKRLEFERARTRLDKKKRTRDMKTHWAHFWNVCPKCGGDMFEQTSLGIKYEACRKCHGIYVDHAEASLVVKFLDVAKWFRAALRRSKDPRTFSD
jgi:Zn-finger nucleic acid-binding protein